MVREADDIFERAAELFGLLSAPVRLRIIGELCRGECNVSQLLERIDCTQPNLSQHLGLMYRTGVLTKRRDGIQIYYQLANESLAAICRTVCTDIAMDEGNDEPADFAKESV